LKKTAPIEWYLKVITETEWKRHYRKECKAYAGVPAGLNTTSAANYRLKPGPGITHYPAS
jgi:hypothetical protein